MINGMLKQLIILSFFYNFVFPLQNTEDLYKIIQTKLIMAEEGDTIVLPEGKYFLKRSLWGESLNNIIIQGSGIDKTVLSFDKQIEGAEGLKIINSNNITLKDFTIENSKGDLIKVEDSKNINFINIKAQWTNGPDELNGSYALYPVKSENILIDKCIAIGASDAGIYVGQSKNIIVTNSEVYNNVAGIEIENSYYADVYNNYVHNNTGGILVFDLPDLKIKSGGYIRVYNNLIVENNLPNFAPEGNIVAKVPAGTGIMILATSNVEVFNNILFNNKTTNTSIVSYFITEEALTDLLYYPYPTGVFIHDNIYKRDSQFPAFSFKQPIGFILAYNFWRNIPDIVYDGIIDQGLLDNSGKYPDKNKICIKNNINASFVNLDAGNDFIDISTNLLEFDCILDNIIPVTYPFE